MDAFAQILAVGKKNGLSLLSSLDPQGRHQLDKREAQRMADEITRISAGGDLRALDDDLTAIAEIARWCARASDNSWMKIETP